MTDERAVRMPSQTVIPAVYGDVTPVEPSLRRALNGRLTGAPR